MIEKFKYLLEKVPPQVGGVSSLLPFKYRLGRIYTEFYNHAVKTQIDRSEIETAIFNYCNSMVSRFPDLFLKSYDVTTIEKVHTWEQFEKLRIITKSDLKKIQLEERTDKRYALTKYNTGGTSGNPLDFYVEKGFFAREWGHMHFLWSKIGYEPSSYKLTIRGKNIGELWKYNFNQNEFLIDSYRNYSQEDYNELIRIVKKYNVSYIHGYPSAIYSFLKELEFRCPVLLMMLQKQVKGILFGSEYPHPKYRDYIETLLTTNTISWYGHTEGAILAGELINKYEYHPFQTYGYTEAVLIGNKYNLVGTSYYNYATPFLRYNTEDIINPEFDAAGLLKSFRIEEGRIGEFIRDKKGKLISLTGLIHGRHHKLFNFVDFIQAKDWKNGQIEIYFSSQDSIDEPEKLFDATGVDLDLTFKKIDEPFKTPLGKVPLLIK